MIQKITFLIGVLLITNYSVAQQQTIDFTIEQVVTDCIGDTVEVNVTTNNFTNILATQFAISWNTNDLCLIEVKNANSDLPNFEVRRNLNSNKEDGRVIQSWFENSLTAQSLPEGAIFFTIVFETLKSEATTSVYFDDSLITYEVLNGEEELVLGNLENGSVQTIDTQKPIPTVSQLPDVIAQCNVVVTPPTATDNCAELITGTTTAPLAYETAGTYMIDWQYDDGNGNVTTQTQRVVIEDTQSPTLAIQPITVDITETGSYTLNQADKIALIQGSTDNCSPFTELEIEVIPNTFSCTDIGMQTVEIMLKDTSGNTATQSTAIMVQHNAKLSPVSTFFQEENLNIIKNITLTRTNSQCPAQVSYHTENISATAGEDYTAANGIIDFAVGELTKDISVTIFADALIEGTELFKMILSNPSPGLNLLENEIIVTIQDRPFAKNALDFDGENDRLTLNQNVDIPNVFTIEAMIKYSGQQYDLEELPFYFTWRPFWGFENGHLTLFYQNIRLSEPFAIDEWQHLLLVVDQNNDLLAVYLNGELADYQPISNYDPDAEQEPVTPISRGLAKVQLAEVAFWERTFTPLEVQERPLCQVNDNESDLLFYFDFSEGIPAGENQDVTTIFDQSSNEYVATLNGFNRNSNTSNFVAANFVINQNCANSLAIEWLGFKVQNIDNQLVKLNWEVSDDINTSTFVVEHSVEGSIFSSIGQVAATTRHNYQFTDENPVYGDNFYRIREITSNGQTTFSNIQKVNLSSTRSYLVYPNPTTQDVTIKLDGMNENNTLIKLIDALGKTVLLSTLEIGNSAVTLDLSNLPAGVFWLQIIDENYRLIEPIVKYEH